VRNGLGNGRVEERIAILGAGIDGDEIALGEPLPDSSADDFGEVGEPAGPFCWR